MQLPKLSERISFFPIVHDRLEFGILLNQHFKSIKPDIICLEMPSDFRTTFRKTLKHMPIISVIAGSKEALFAGLPYEDDAIEYFVRKIIASDSEKTGASRKKKDPDDADLHLSAETHLYLMPEYTILDPGNIFIEACRLAEESKIPWKFIDCALPYSPHIRDAIPDPYVLEKMDLSDFYKLCILANSSLDSLSGCDRYFNFYRESKIANDLYSFSRVYKNILFVGGLMHGPGITKLIDLLQNGKQKSLKKAEKDYFSGFYKLYLKEKLEKIISDDTITLEVSESSRTKKSQKIPSETKILKLVKKYLSAFRYTQISLHSLNPESI